MQTVRALLRRIGARTPFGRDAVLAAALAAAGVALLVAGAVATDGGGPGISRRGAPLWLAIAAITGGAAAIAWRRRSPATVVAVTVVGHVAQLSLLPDHNVGWPSVWVALYSIGAYAGRRPAVVGWALACLTYAGLALASGTALVVAARGTVNNAVTLAVVTLSGAYLQTRRAYRTELRARVERERRERIAGAVLDERGRIARELHDVVAHHLSGMVVQVGAAERLLDTDPDRARALMTDIRATGRDTLAGMRRLIGVLRAGDDRDEVGPRPGLAQLDVLAQRARSAGVPVEVAVEGQVQRLPDEVDLAASRILQEALTNVRKHAPGAIARTVVRYGPHDVEIRVTDDGRRRCSRPSRPEASGWWASASGSPSSAVPSAPGHAPREDGSCRPAFPSMAEHVVIPETGRTR